MHLVNGLGVLQLQPNFVVYNRHGRNHTSKHPICEKRQPFKYLSGWWQLKHILFSPLLPGEMIQFDGCIFVKWVGSTINSNALSRGWIYLIIPIQSIHFAVSFQDPKICPTVETVLFDALLKTRLIQDTFDLGF